MGYSPLAALPYLPSGCQRLLWTGITVFQLGQPTSLLYAIPYLSSHRVQSLPPLMPNCKRTAYYYFQLWSWFVLGDDHSHCEIAGPWEAPMIELGLTLIPVAGLFLRWFKSFFQSQKTLKLASQNPMPTVPLANFFRFFFRRKRF